MDKRMNGVEVGKYNPKYIKVDKRVTSHTLAGKFNFLTEQERDKLVETFEIENKKEVNDLSPIQRKKKSTLKI